MRRVTIREAASLLGVDENEVNVRIKRGRLVVCQEAQHRGYVWVPEPTAKALPSGGTFTIRSQKTKEPPAETGKQGNEVAASVGTGVAAATQKSKSGAEEGERRPRTSQRAQEVQILQEVVAMLKEELRAKDRQLELKDAEIKARREEVKGLLAVLNQSRALPEPSDNRALSTSAPSNNWPRLSLALESLPSAATKMLQHPLRLISRFRGQVNVDARAGTVASEGWRVLSRLQWPGGNNPARAYLGALNAGVITRRK